MGGGSYEIRIKRRLSDSLLAVFEGLTASVEPVEPVLHGPVQDQAALYGLLDRIQVLGLELVEVRRLPDTPDEPAGGNHPEVRQAAARRLVDRLRRRQGRWSRPLG
jgi:hypothetical protein